MCFNYYFLRAQVVRRTSVKIQNKSFEGSIVSEENVGNSSSGQGWGWDQDDLCRAGVFAMDSSKLTTEQLQNMKALLPTIDEFKKR